MQTFLELRPPMSPFSLFFLLITTILLFSSSTVRSDSVFASSAIRLPSEKTIDFDPDDPCSGSVVRPGSCPVKCFRPDPVCGVDEVTYWCGCPDAACAGVKVAKLGYCEVGNGGSGPVSGQALLLVHMVWLIVVGFAVVFGFF